jgi:hypothetical protein
MCESHGRHVTVINGTTRCVLCGHRVSSRKLRLRDLPGELIDRHRARERWWNEPELLFGQFWY